MPLKERLFLRFRFKKRHGGSDSATPTPPAPAVTTTTTTVTTTGKGIATATTVRPPQQQQHQHQQQQHQYQPYKKNKVSEFDTDATMRKGMIKIMSKMSILVGLSITSTFIFILFALFLPQTGIKFMLFSCRLSFVIFSIFFLCVCVCVCVLV